jgi:hypothetical protein
MAKKIITIGKQGIRERIEGSGPIDSYSFDNLQVNSPYTVGELPEDRFTTIQDAIDQWDADGQPNWPIMIRPKKLTANYLFASPNIEGAYIEDLVIPVQKPLTPQFGFFSADQSSSLTLVGLTGMPLSGYSLIDMVAEIPREIQVPELSRMPVIIGNITITGSPDDDLGGNLRLHNLFINHNDSQTPLLQIGGNANSEVMYTLLATNCEITATGDLFSSGNTRLTVAVKDSRLRGNANLFTDRDTTDNGLTNTFLIGANCNIVGLNMEGAGCIPEISLTQCKIYNPVTIDGDMSSATGEMVFHECEFFLNGSGNGTLIPDEGSAIRISTTTGTVRFNNCTMLLKRASGANCSVLDLNTDCYFDAAISVDSLGTGDFAISSDGNAYTLYANVKEMPPNGVPTTTTDGNVTVANPNVTLT